MTAWKARRGERLEAQEVLQARLMVKLQTLTPEQLKLLLDFADQIVAFYDPDAVADFLDWRNDPKLGTILQLAAALSDDMRDQLVFKAEEYYSEESKRLQA